MPKIVPKSIREPLEQMYSCTLESLYASDRYGKNSPQHLIRYGVFMEAARAYEAACRAINHEPYVTLPDTAARTP